KPVCPECGGKRLKRVMSTFVRARNTKQRLEDIDHVRQSAALQSGDVGAFARWAREAGAEYDEELGTNYRELAERAEAGENPVERIDADYTFRYKVEEKMSRLSSSGDDGGGGSSGGDEFGHAHGHDH